MERVARERNGKGCEGKEGLRLVLPHEQPKIATGSFNFFHYIITYYVDISLTVKHKSHTKKYSKTFLYVKTAVNCDYLVYKSYSTRTNASVFNRFGDTDIPDELSTCKVSKIRC